MKKFIGIILGVVIIFGIYSIASAENTSTPITQNTQVLIQQLQEQIEKLKTQIQALIQAKEQVQSTTKEVKTSLRLLTQLREGMTSDEVKTLQEILATDPSIYPEGKITGYFGFLTRQAVKRFQKIAGLEQVGTVGPKTLAKLNELLTEGAGNSGKVPFGLLIAPGIRAKLGLAPVVSANKEDKTTAPIIWAITSAPFKPGTTSEKITWTTDEESDSKVWYSAVSPVVTASPTLYATSTTAVLTKNHEVVIIGLTTNTKYYFKLTSTDEHNNTATSVELSFTTMSLPVISAVTAVAGTPATTSEKITWTTDVNTDSNLWYNTTSPVNTSGTPQGNSSTFTKNHEIILTGLTANTTYYYKITSTDIFSNTATVTESSFTTAAQ